MRSGRFLQWVSFSKGCICQLSLGVGQDIKRTGNEGLIHLTHGAVESRYGISTSSGKLADTLDNEPTLGKGYDVATYKQNAMFTS